jgi:predicted ATPase
VQPTLLIGREKELEEVDVLLCRDDVRLLTLTGTGGTGKTRLALQAAADLIDQFANGVFFVSLSPISDAELVMATIAQTLGLREHSGDPLIETLGEYLHDKGMLLVLDNFEQVVTAASSVASLVSSARGLKVLVTSRTPLHISGERTYEVPPLALPDTARLPEISALTQYEAVALFIERAQAAKSGFTVTNENAAAIAEICVRLDGLPLALELAAARVPALPPKTLLAHLDHRLKLLTGGAQDLEERQRTLRATIDWSYDLLSEEEKTLFTRLGVFVNGCRVDAAEALCEGENDDAQLVLDGLTSLVEKSLLQQKEDPDGEPRFWMLETIREYASERLEETRDMETVRRRHAEYFQRLSEEAAGQLEGGEQQSAWMMRLEQDHGNLRAALTFWRCQPDSQLALARSLGPFWLQRGHWLEGRRWHEEALAAGDRSSPHRLKALDDVHWLAYLQGDTQRARTVLDELLPLARRLENRQGIGVALHGLANLALNEGDYERATVLFEESLDLHEAEHDSMHPLQGLSCVALLRDDFNGARALLERSIMIGRTFKDDYEVANCLAILAAVAAFAGDEQKAETLLREGVALARKLDSRPGLVTCCLPALAALRSLQGNAQESVRLMGASEALREEMGSPGGVLARHLKHRILESAQSDLEEAQIATALEEGRGLPLDEALACAPGNQQAPAQVESNHAQ